jgi:hypothetical protein
MRLLQEPNSGNPSMPGKLMPNRLANRLQSHLTNDLLEKPPQLGQVLQSLRSAPKSFNQPLNAAQELLLPLLIRMQFMVQ